MTELSRKGRPAAPIRQIHLGLGAFFRAHQAWYTDACLDGEQWGIAAFTGRSTRLATTLTAQDGLYTLVSRGAQCDSFSIIRSLSRAHAGTDTRAWLDYFSAEQISIVSLTVTEGGYARNAAGGLDASHIDVRQDIDSLRTGADDHLATVPGRLVAGLAARRRRDAGPITLLSCDNLPDNGTTVLRVTSELAAQVDVTLVDWIEQSVTSVSTLVDRITPATTVGEADAVQLATGYRDAAPVVTEPYSEWVLSGRFAAGRPSWDSAGAVITDDLTPFEQRKLWLLNGAHTLLAYTAPNRGHHTVAEAIADDTVRGWLEQWWDEAQRHLSLPAEQVLAYRAALVERFANSRICHQLAQIAADGSQKLPARILPVLRLERTAHRLPNGAVLALAGWLNHLLGHGVPVADQAATALRAEIAGKDRHAAASATLRFLDATLADDIDLVHAVAAAARLLA